MIDALPVRRRLVGAALRRYRENLGFGLEEAARILECDRSKISRIETGQRGIRPKELRELLTEYGVTNHEQGALAAIAQTARRDSWWQPFGDVIDEQFRELLALESAAAEILLYDALQVPALLQTPRYAQAVADASAVLPADLPPETITGITTGRQRAVFGERRIRVLALIGEAALRPAIASDEIMREQLARLIEIGTTSAETTIQILPLLCGAPSCGPAAILRFAEASSLGAVYLAGLSGGVCLAGQEDVARYTRAFEHLKTFALSTTESARLLEKTTAGRIQASQTQAAGARPVRGARIR
jgi:transcriptional regulator with XRE-family HTH domain